MNQDPRHAIRRFNLMGFAAIAVLIGGVGGWAATSQLSGAVIAPGTMVVQSNVKKVQHPTGGIVGAIMVKEGEAVEEGRVLLRLDDTLTRATLGIVRSQLNELTAREARLLAERDGAASIAFSESLTAQTAERSVVTAIAGEEKLFESRRSTRNGQKAQLRERISQTNEEIRGLSAQLSGKENEIRFIGEELAGVADLYRKNLIPIVRYMQLQRDQARLEGERGHLIAEMARARIKIGETELQIIQIDQDFRTEVLKELRDVQGRIAELKERVTAAEDQLRRIDIVAPQAGVVHRLSVHTVGDDLVVEAKVAPQDIDQLALGAKTVVRIMAGNQRTTPDAAGTLIRISADLTREPQDNIAYYLVRVSLAPQEVTRLGDLKLVPGMPAEVFIQTQERTPLQYLLKPFQEQIPRAFRER